MAAAPDGASLQLVRGLPPRLSAPRSSSPRWSARASRATRLSPDDVGLQLLGEQRRSSRRGAGRADPRAAAGCPPRSNPVVTLVERGLGLLSTAQTVALIAAQWPRVVGRWSRTCMSTCRRSPSPLSARAQRSQGCGSGVCGHVGPGPRVCSAPSRGGRRTAVAFRRRRLLHRGVLVHQLDQLRQPGRDLGPRAVS